MNIIELNLHHVANDDSLMIDGILFRNAAFVRLLIDGNESTTYKYLDVSLIVFSELVRSLTCNGCYLIFTSASGIADDGGWEGVKVNYNNNGTVSWEFIIEDKKYYFEFPECEYRNAIQALEKKINNLPEDIKLEPTEVFFPESWD